MIAVSRSRCRQLPLELTTPDDLARFCIPHQGKHIAYGDVSRRMGQLRRRGRGVELADLVAIAADLYKAPEWHRILAGWLEREGKCRGGSV